LINARDLTDLTIVGGGTIDGSGAAFWGNDPRPRLVVLERCQRVVIQGVTFQNSPSFHIVPSNSQDVLIDGVTILAPPDSPNTDGIDPSSSVRVTISNCYIDTGDDNVALKASGGPTSQVLVTDCTFLHGHGMSIGTGLRGGVSNVTVQRLTFDGTTNGLRVKANRSSGGVVSYISYDCITMHNVDRPIDIIGYYPESSIPPSGTDSTQPVTETTPQYRNISISNLTATDDRPGTKNAAMIIGVPESPLDGIVLRNVSISGAGKGAWLRNANVELRNVNIDPVSGPNLIVEENVTVSDCP